MEYSLINGWGSGAYRVARVLIDFTAFEGRIRLTWNASRVAKTTTSCLGTIFFDAVDV
jgi:hypothetical protein